MKATELSKQQKAARVNRAFKISGAGATAALLLLSGQANAQAKPHAIGTAKFGANMATAAVGGVHDADPRARGRPGAARAAAEPQASRAAELPRSLGPALQQG